MDNLQKSEVSKSIRMELISKNPEPNIENFYNLATGLATWKVAELNDFAQKVLKQNGLVAEDELALEESYDYLSSQGFKFLFPRILIAYLDDTFSKDGNFVSMLWDSCEEDTSFQSRKHGRGKRMDMLTEYRDTLNCEQKKLLNLILVRLECLPS